MNSRQLGLPRSGPFTVRGGYRAKTIGKAVTLRLRQPDGAETSHQFQAGKADPFFLDDGERLLALCSLDGARIHPLRRDGDPLDLAPLGIAPEAAWPG